VVVRALANRPRRLPTLPEWAVLVGFGIAVCSLAQTPAPWTQVERLGQQSPVPRWGEAATERFVAAHTSRGEPVAILGPLGHRIAYDLGLDNVSPYSSIEAIPLRSQLDEAIAALREAGGTKLFLPIEGTYREQLAAVRRAGFRISRWGSEAENAVLLETAVSAG
jgi:hypothetical protein